MAGEPPPNYVPINRMSQVFKHAAAFLLTSAHAQCVRQHVFAKVDEKEDLAPPEMTTYDWCGHIKVPVHGLCCSAHLAM